jgi:hypothetical protein
MKQYLKNKIRDFLRGYSLLAVFVMAGIFMQSCSNDETFVETYSKNENFPTYAVDFGKSVANEIQHLEKQGQMLRTPRSDIQRIRLKSGNESGSNSGSCYKFLATVWVVAVGEPTPVGEIVAAIATVVVGGILLYEVIVCNSANSSSELSSAECLERYNSCMDTPLGNSNSGGYGYTMCGRCLSYCYVQHVWDCPRPQ